MQADERLPVQRAARIVFRLTRGEQLSTAEIAALLCVSRSTAYRLLCVISEEIPIYIERGKWRVCERLEERS